MLNNMLKHTSLEVLKHSRSVTARPRAVKEPHLHQQAALRPSQCPSSQGSHLSRSSLNVPVTPLLVDVSRRPNPQKAARSRLRWSRRLSS